MKTTDATSDVLGPEFLPLRGLANILTVLLAIVVAFIGARLAIHLFSPGSMHYFTDLPETGSRVGAADHARIMLAKRAGLLPLTRWPRAGQSE